MVLPNMLPPHMMGQFGAMGMMTPMGAIPQYMSAPPGMQMMPPPMLGGPPRPLFPAAMGAVTSVAQTKATFPAYRYIYIKKKPRTIY